MADTVKAFLKATFLFKCKVSLEAEKLNEATALQVKSQHTYLPALGARGH